MKQNPREISSSYPNNLSIILTELEKILFMEGKKRESENPALKNSEIEQPSRKHQRRESESDVSILEPLTSPSEEELSWAYLTSTVTYSPPQPSDEFVDRLLAEPLTEDEELEKFLRNDSTPTVTYSSSPPSEEFVDGRKNRERKNSDPKNIATPLIPSNVTSIEDLNEFISVLHRETQRDDEELRTFLQTHDQKATPPQPPVTYPEPQRAKDFKFFLTTPAYKGKNFEDITKSDYSSLGQQMKPGN